MYQLVWNNLGLVDVDSSRGQALLVRTKKEKALFFYEKMRFFSSPFIFFVAFLFFFFFFFLSSPFVFFSRSMHLGCWRGCVVPVVSSTMASHCIFYSPCSITMYRCVRASRRRSFMTTACISPGLISTDRGCAGRRLVESTA